MTWNLFSSILNIFALSRAEYSDRQVTECAQSFLKSLTLHSKQRSWNEQCTRSVWLYVYYNFLSFYKKRTPYFIFGGWCFKTRFSLGLSLCLISLPLKDVTDGCPAFRKESERYYGKPWLYYSPGYKWN